MVGREGRPVSCPCSIPRKLRWCSRPERLGRPDVCLVHVSQSAHGSSVEVLADGEASRNTDDKGNGHGHVTFSAWRRPSLRQLREFSLQGVKFYAFTVPHENTIQVAVWRQLGDVVAAGYRSSFDSSLPILVKVVAPEDSLSPGRIAARIGPLADLYQRKPFDRKTWVYWESFWVPGKVGKMCLKPLEAQSSVVLYAGQVPRPRHSAAVSTQDLAALESKAHAFADIYRRGVWPGICSRSGPGSDPFHPMARIAITALDMAVDLLEATSMLDAACGDAAWIACGFLSRRPEVKYTGVDIVEHVIEENRQKFPALRFMAADFSRETSLPATDFVFSKETLNHMFLDDAVRALHVLQSSGTRYLVTNIHRGAPNQLGETKGHHAHYAPYDYSLPPFNLRKLCQLVSINLEDWTEYALFAL
ncbi:unnamed protein product [Durusdinium trenchii]|uniref:Uncharacterized protein n=2 Tax=Durusdinium trenchii TaxID=1381693 RepID=A0ABP0RVP1_9DINO